MRLQHLLYLVEVVVRPHLDQLQVGLISRAHILHDFVVSAHGFDLSVLILDLLLKFHELVDISLHMLLLVVDILDYGLCCLHHLVLTV